MKTLLNWLLLLICLLIVGFGSFKAGEANYRNKLRADAGLDTAKLMELEQLDSLHRAQAKMWEAKATFEETTRLKDQQQYATELTKLRKLPARIVKVPEVRLIECDSAIASGQSYRREVEIQKMQLIELKEVISVQDTAIEYLGDIAEMSQQRHKDDLELIDEVKATNERERKRKILWRSVSLITSAGLLTILL